jgi:DNA-binding transcriptional MerR regulator
MGEYRNNVNTFTAENADFPSAYNFLLNQRQQELTVMGFNAQEIGQILQNEEIGIVEQAFRNKVNPAKSIYDIAKFRGYKLEEKSEGKKEEVKEEKEEIKPTLEAEKKAEAAAKNLGGLPGTSGGKLNAEALLAMSEEEFSKATKDGEWQKIMGG